MLSDGNISHPKYMDSHVGIAIKKIRENQNHVGLLYRDSTGVKLCHLAFHHDLRIEAARPDYCWAVASVFAGDDLSAQVFAGRLIVLSEKQGYIPNEIPYGFHSEGTAFNTKGEFVGFPKAGMGLTCATFILEMFHSMAFPIANLETWIDRDSDLEWQNVIVETLQELYPEHAKAVANYRGSVRVRPEEVVACAITMDPPTAFERATQLAGSILSEIEAASKI